MAVNFTGISSGIDTAAIIKATLEAQRAPLRQLETRKSSYTARISDLGAIASKLDELKSLAGETIRDNARFFTNPEEVPRLAVTMGVGTILESRRCLILATGQAKAEAIRATIEGPVTAQVTASALQLHRDVTAIVDEQAAVRLARRDYYREVEQAELALRDGTFKFGPRD